MQNIGAKPEERVTHGWMQQPLDLNKAGKQILPPEPPEGCPADTLSPTNDDICLPPVELSDNKPVSF